MNDARYQRWLALSLLGLVLFSVIFLVLLPLFSSWLDYREQKNDLLFRLQRQQAIVARRDSVAQNLESLNQQYQQQGYLSDSDTEALASAELQNIVKTAVTEAGGQLTSTQGLPGKAEEDFVRVAVKVRMSGSIEALRAVLHSLDTNMPLLLVDQLDISPVRGARNRTTNKMDPSSQLNVSFEVISFMRAKTS
ncbi:type II secretion system protein GspM [Methylomonas sp. MO1]|uniref:type II secretion system protein GspM n=1 Tax=unclassified Methylomonas TaxID=2608980 RepID=UPI000363AB4F|nr:MULTISPECIES: type II secretion system protein GspM [unclassified Methylomonas]MDT4292295.1 type II secretion system protein GspM [Methylomonas sp. MO1]